MIGWVISITLERNVKGNGLQLIELKESVNYQDIRMGLGRITDPRNKTWTQYEIWLLVFRPSMFSKVHF
jgi:hypothetical protein